MNQIDFSTYKFRPSQMDALMKSPRSKTETISATAKEYLNKIWVTEMTGRTEDRIVTRPMEKGIICESDSLDLVQKATGQVYFKNQQKISNEFIEGTPDVVSPLLDIKTSYSIFSYAKVDYDYAVSTYKYQLLSYMWLTGQKTGDLIFCLTNSTEEMIAEEMERNRFKNPEIMESDEATEEFRKNFIFNDIPLDQRIKRFTVEYSEEEIELMKEKISACRTWLINKSRL